MLWRLLDLVGTAVTGAGAGTHPLYVSCRVYLAGPYKGAPLSLVAPAREMSMMVGAMFGMLILGERVTAWRIIGCLILIGGVILLGSASA